MSYSTQLALSYPLGSVVILDLAYQGSGIYSSDGTEGAWYVAGWSAKSDLKLTRDRRLAYMGEWEIMSHIQTVIGSPEWWGFHGKSASVNARISQVVGPIPIQIVNLKHKSHPDPYLTPLLTPLLTPAAFTSRESWGDGQYDTTQYLESLYAAGNMTLRREWAIIPDLPIDQAETLWRERTSQRPGGFGGGLGWHEDQTRTLLFERTIRRGVIEPWHLTSTDRLLIDSLDQIPNDATPLHPLLILRRRIDQEDDERDFEIRAYESAIQAELEAYREHEAKSALAFRKLYDGKNEEGRTLTRKYTATMLYFKANRDLFESLKLADDPVFRPLYDAMMDSTTIPTKRATLRKVLDWLRWKKGIDIPIPAESESKPEEVSK